jgi:hypothetical protein
VEGGFWKQSEEKQDRTPNPEINQHRPVIHNQDQTNVDLYSTFRDKSTQTCTPHPEINQHRPALHIQR